MTHFSDIKASLAGGIFSFVISSMASDLLWAFVLGAMGALGGLCLNKLFDYIKRRFRL